MIHLVNLFLHFVWLVRVLNCTGSRELEGIRIKKCNDPL